MPQSQDLDSFDPQAFLDKVGTGKSRTFQKNQTIFEQGDVADTIFYIKMGRIKLEVQSQQGRGAVVGILGTGHFFGEGCMNGHQFRMMTTRAMEESVVTLITRRAMSAMLDGEPSFSEMFIAYLLMRNVRIEADLVDHLFHSSEKRLARLLLLLANGDSTIDPMFAQGTLAEMVGTTRSRVNFFMNKFRKLGLVRYNGYGRVEIDNALLGSVLQESHQASNNH